MFLQQMTERVLQTISRFEARQGRPPQWNYEEKQNVWSLATARRHCVERKLLPAISERATWRREGTAANLESHTEIR
ncbi:hypothetical protein T03_918 [Trichinella britovi]|uniref:Uncharacterized protein n=1 Tax=Trichinella britovi TaxID=45882 RepID=A0A0V0Z071_TRIBR|nr:hypothetical protein T03_918 [Trichinella britovi]